MLEKIFFENPNTESLKHLIGSFYPTGNYYSKPTYRDEKCTILEFKQGRRSFEDLLIISRTYFPDTTEIELMKALRDNNLKFYRCGYLKKIVFARICSYQIKRDCFTNYFGYVVISSTYQPEQLNNIVNEMLKQEKISIEKVAEIST